MRTSDIRKGIHKHARFIGHPHPRPDAGDAFIKDPSGKRGMAHTRDELAETLAEQFVDSVTMAQSSNGFDDPSFPEEVGGPFITTRAKQEFARDIDPSNPVDAEREALPTAMSEVEGEPEEEEEEEGAVPATPR
jgi:hypothetical protein